jgi:hypothetical protein
MAVIKARNHRILVWVLLGLGAFFVGVKWLAVLYPDDADLSSQTGLARGVTDWAFFFLLAAGWMAIAGWNTTRKTG